MCEDRGKLLASILCVTDRHKRDIDFSSIKGYCDASAQVTEDILEIIQEKDITHVVEMGDLYHRGYTKISAQYADVMDDIAIRDAVNGNYYGVVGNHLMLERDNNPEFYLIQPNNYPDLQPILKRKFRQPIIRVVDDLVIGPVQMSFFHYNKENKDYVAERRNGIKYHVGFYHDDSVVPNHVREQCGIKAKVTSDYMNRIYSNIDYAFLAHIHTDIGLMKLKLKSGKIVLAYLQGAATITSSKASEYHKYVMLPIIQIYENTMIVEKVKLSLHTEMMEIYKEEEKITDETQDIFVPVKTKKKFKVDASQVEHIEVCDTVSQYLNSIDATGRQLALFELAMNTELTDLNVDSVLENQAFEDILGVECD